MTAPMQDKSDADLSGNQSGVQIGQEPGYPARAEAQLQQTEKEFRVERARAEAAEAEARRLAKERDDARFFADQFKAALHNATDRDREHMERLADRAAAAEAREQALRDRVTELADKCDRGGSWVAPGMAARLRRVASPPTADTPPEDKPMTCTCGENDACSSCNNVAAHMQQGTFNQCETHGKCVDENWVDEKGVSHAECLGPIPEHLRHRLFALRFLAAMKEHTPTADTRPDRVGIFEDNAALLADTDPAPDKATP